MGGDEFLGKSKVADAGGLKETCCQSESIKSIVTIPQVGMLPIGSLQTCETKRVSPGLWPKIRTVFKELSICAIKSCSIPALERYRSESKEISASGK